MKIELFISRLKDDLHMWAHFETVCELFVKFLEGSVKVIYYRRKDISSAKSSISISFQAGRLCKREKITFSNQFDDCPLSTTLCQPENFQQILMLNQISLRILVCKKVYHVTLHRQCMKKIEKEIEKKSFSNILPNSSDEETKRQLSFVCLSFFYELANISFIPMV